MSEFAVDPVIQSLTYHLADWPLSRIFVYNDSRFAWGLLVPRRVGVVEICDLGAADQAQLMGESDGLSKLIRTRRGVEKLIVGALGIMVSRLHVHVIGGHKGDPAGPGPVWGHSPPVPWPDPAAAPLAQLVSK